MAKMFTKEECLFCEQALCDECDGRLCGHKPTLMIEDTYDTKAAPFGMAVDEAAPSGDRTAIAYLAHDEIAWYDEVARIPPELMNKIFHIDPQPTPFVELLRKAQKDASELLSGQLWVKSRQCGVTAAIEQMKGVWLRTLEEVEREIEVLEASGDDELCHVCGDPMNSYMHFGHAPVSNHQYQMSLLREERARLLAEQDLKGLDE